MSLDPTVCDHKGQSLWLSTCSPWERSIVVRGRSNVGDLVVWVPKILGLDCCVDQKVWGSIVGWLTPRTGWLCLSGGFKHVQHCRHSRLVHVIDQSSYCWLYMDTLAVHLHKTFCMTYLSSSSHYQLIQWTRIIIYFRTLVKRTICAQSFVIVDLWFMFLLTLPPTTTTTLARMLNGQVCSCLFNTNWIPPCVRWLAHPLQYT